MRRRREDMDEGDEQRTVKGDELGVGNLPADDDMGPGWWRLSRMDQAHTLRLRGMSFRQIGEWLHVDEKTARQWARQVEREQASQRNDEREQLLSSAVDRMHGLAIEAAAHYDTTHEATLLAVRLRCEKEIARLQGLYEIAQEAATHEGTETDGGLVPIRFFDASAAIDDITGGPARDREGDE